MNTRKYFSSILKKLSAILAFILLTITPPALSTTAVTTPVCGFGAQAGRTIVSFSDKKLCLMVTRS